MLRGRKIACRRTKNGSSFTIQEDKGKISCSLSFLRKFIVDSVGKWVHIFYVVGYHVKHAISLVQLKFNILFEAKNSNSVETGEFFFEGSLTDYQPIPMQLKYGIAKYSFKNMMGIF